MTSGCGREGRSVYGRAAATRRKRHSRRAAAGTRPSRALEIAHRSRLQRFGSIPLASAAFDTVAIVVSVQYLVRPYEVFQSAYRLLKPGGQCIVMMSNRMFPSKAIYAFHILTTSEKIALVQDYMKKGSFSKTEFIDRSPPEANPLWIVRGEKA